ncbi:hypothetical protein JCM3766R1_000795 [Sporobolomyces carnicolor]
MIQTSQAPAYSTRAYAYHSARLHASCGAAALLSPPVQAQITVSPAPAPRFPDLSILRSNLPPVVPTSPSAFPMLSVGTPARETPPGTPSFFPSFLSSSQRAPSYLSSSPSTYALHPQFDSSSRSPRPPLRPTGSHFASSGMTSYNSNASSSTSSSYSNGSTTTASTALPTPSIDKFIVQPCDLGLEFEDEEEEKLFRLSVQMREGEFDGDMEDDGEWYSGDYDDVGMEGTETMEME